MATNEDLTIKKSAETIQKSTTHKCDIVWDDKKPDGTPRKLMNVSKMHNLGCKYKIQLKKGIQKTYHWFLENIFNYKGIKL